MMKWPYVFLIFRNEHNKKDPSPHTITIENKKRRTGGDVNDKN